jgi:predicted acyltransferase
MTFVDIVFPAFLFIVGMSIPFALERRFERLESAMSVWLHILARTVSLLAIGVYMVNTESMAAMGLIHRSLWTLLMYAGVLLVWLSPPRSLSWKPSTITGMRVAGTLLLLVLAFLYRAEEGTGLMQMRTHWWGILGIIGWSYLACCVAYVLFRRNTTALLGATVIGYCVYVADSVGHFPAWAGSVVDLGGVGSHGALTISGAVLGVMLLPGSPLKTHGERMRWALLYSIGMAVAAYLLHTAGDVHRMFIINKVFATPPWSLWCAAITVWVWLVLYWCLDVVNKRRWSSLLELSGQNALLAYILAPIFYASFSLIAVTLDIPNFYRELGAGLGTGIGRSIIFAVLIVWMAAAMRRSNYLLKL